MVSLLGHQLTWPKSWTSQTNNWPNECHRFWNSFSLVHVWVQVSSNWSHKGSERDQHLQVKNVRSMVQGAQCNLSPSPSCPPRRFELNSEWFVAVEEAWARRLAKAQQPVLYSQSGYETFCLVAQPKLFTIQLNFIEQHTPQAPSPALSDMKVSFESFTPNRNELQCRYWGAKEDWLHKTGIFFRREE